MNPDTVIDVPFTDARASELCYALGLDRLDALKTRSFELEGLQVELRILGCSHQVLVESDDLMLAASETVACLPAETLAGTDATPCLPAVHEETWGEISYRMLSRVRDLSGMQAGLDGVIAQHAVSSRGLVGVFPGHPYAFTALSASALRGRPGITWQTFHAYPQSDELVVTTSTLETPAR